MGILVGPNALPVSRGRVDETTLETMRKNIDFFENDVEGRDALMKHLVRYGPTGNPPLPVFPVALPAPNPPVNPVPLPADHFEEKRRKRKQPKHQQQEEEEEKNDRHVGKPQQKKPKEGRANNSN